MLLVLGIVVSVRAQSSRDQARRVILGQPKNSYPQQTRTVILGRNGEATQPQRVYRTNNVYYPRREHEYYHKTNPGRHLGWYKGVGNPHRYGGNPGKGNKKGWKR